MARGERKLATLFFLLEARTKGLDNDVRTAEKSLGRITSFIQKNPIVAAASLGAAFAGVGFAALKMASDVDSAIRKISATLPDAANKVKELRQTFEDLSRESGRSQLELATAANEVAKGGVQNVEELQAQLRAAVELADATGTDLTRVISGLDQSLDLFGKSGKDAEGVLARLFVTAQNKTSIEDLFAALDKAAPVVQRLKAAGIEQPFEKLIAALTTLQSQGFNTKNAIAELNKSDISRIEDLARQSANASDGLKEMRTQADLNNNSLGALSARLKAEFNSALIDLGNTLLPIAIKEMQGFIGVIDLLFGRLDAQRAAGGVATLATLTKAVDNLTGEARVDALKRIREGLDQALNRDFDLGVSHTTQQLDGIAASIASWPLEKQKAVRDGLVALLQAGGNVGGVEQAQRILHALNQTLANAPTPAVTPTGGTGTGTGTTLTAEQIAALRKAREELEFALREKVAALTNSLVDDTILALDRFKAEFEKKAIAAGGTVLENFNKLVADFKQRIQDATIGTVTPTLTDTRSADQIAVGQQLLTNAERMTAEFKKLPGIIDQQVEALEREAKQLDEIRDKEKRAAIEARVAQLERIRAIDQAITGALQLADAVGIIDENSRQALEAIAQIGTTLASAVDEAGNFKLDFSSALSIAGAAATLIGGLFSGPSPEELHRAQVLQDNTEAILELTQSIGDLGLLSGTPGSTIVGVQEAGRAALAGRDTSTIGGALGSGDLAGELAKLGLTMKDLREVASGLGVSFVGAIPSAAELAQLLDAIAAADLARFQDTFGGQLQALQDEFELFDITDPIEQLEKFRELMERFGDPAIAQQLGAFDLKSAEGRAAAERFIQDLFERLNKSVAEGGLTVAELGGLTPEEFRDFLKRFEGLIDQANEGGPSDGSSTSFQFQNMITEDTGRQISGVLLSQFSIQQEIAATLALILAAVSGAGLVLPPPIPAALVTPVPSEINITVALGPLQVTIEGPVDLATAADVGALVGRGIQQQITDTLSQELRKSVALSGSQRFRNNS